MPHQNVLVTGANRGIGYELVRQLLALSPAPKNVIATTRSASDKLTQLKSAHSNLHILTYDAINYDSYPEFVKQVEAIVGDAGLDLLINNAGILLHNTLQSVTPQDLLKNFETNSVAPFTLTQSLLPLLRKSAAASHKTVIVNVTSGLGSIAGVDQTAFITLPSYRASKSALNMLSKLLAVELKKDGIIVLALCPGHVQTDMGGADAPVEPATSIKGILNVIGQLDLEQSGSYQNYASEKYGW